MHAFMLYRYVFDVFLNVTRSVVGVLPVSVLPQLDFMEPWCIA